MSRAAATALWLLLVAAAWACLFNPDSGGLRFGIDTSPQALLDRDDPRVARQAYLSAEFSLDPRWLVTLPTQALIDAGFEDAVVQVHVSLAELPGVAAVDSLATAPLVRISDFGIDNRPIIERLDEQSLPELLQAAREDPFLSGALISPDGSRAGFAVTLAPEVAGQELALAEQIRTALATQPGQRELRIAGASLMEAASGAALLESLQTLMPRLIAAICLLLLLLSRRIHTALFCAAVVVSTMSWTGAIVALSGLDLNLVTSLLPPLLVSLSVGYGLYASSAGNASGLGLASVTTAAGFLALAITPVPAVRQFAVFAALGTACVWLSCVLLLKLLPPPPAVVRKPSRHARRATLWLARIHRRYRKHLLAGAIVVAAIAVMGIPLINAGTEFSSSLPPDSQVRQLSLIHISEPTRPY